MSNYSSFRQSSSRPASLMDYSGNTSSEQASEESLNFQHNNESNYQFQVSTEASQMPLTEEEVQKIVTRATQPIIAHIKNLCQLNTKTCEQLGKLNEKVDRQITGLHKKIEQLSQNNEKRFKKLEQILFLVAEIPKQNQNTMKQMASDINKQKKNHQEHLENNFSAGKQRIQSTKIMNPSFFSSQPKITKPERNKKDHTTQSYPSFSSTTKLNISEKKQKDYMIHSHQTIKTDNKKIEFEEFEPYRNRLINIKPVHQSTKPQATNQNQSSQRRVTPQNIREIIKRAQESAKKYRQKYGS